MAWREGFARQTAEAAPQIMPGADTTIEGRSAGKRGTVAYFGPDADDAAVRRRVAQWIHAGFRVLPFAFVRSGAGSELREFIDLGTLMPQSLILRMVPIARAALRLLRHRRRLATVQVFVGRNLDNALLALFARYISGSSGPLVYEILDVNRACTEPGLRGAIVRRVEWWLLGRATLLIVSSPHFATAYFQRMLGYRGDWALFENKVPRFAYERQADLRPMPDAAAARERPWRIGWFGYLDDERSWEILRRVAESLPQEVIIHVRGIAYLDFDMDRFLADVEGLENVVYGGPYRNPEDLAEIYNAVDLVWSTDCNALTGNSKWLLTNGLYEAGYFGKPVLGMVGTAVGEFVAEHGTGWCIEAPTAPSLINVIRDLSPEIYAAKCREILRMRSRLFVETDEVDQIWARLEARPSQQVVSRRETTDEPARDGIEGVASTQRSKLLCLGLFPPPVDGQRLITQAVFERFDEMAQVEYYDLDRLQRLRVLSRPLSALGACFAILRARVKGFSALYLAPHSGRGLLLSCLVALVARCLGYSLAVHYHSYRNVERRSRLMTIFVAICGAKAIHVVLAPPMGRDLRRLYPGIGRVAAVSNCGFIAPHSEIPRHFGVRRFRIGHLSNLSREKGIVLVLECMRALRTRGLDVELWLAGPTDSQDTEALIVAAQTEVGDRLRYLGRRDGEEVRRFYQDIDVFLFPSVHRHEAEPLVVIDAVASGVPVIATDRGCIGYLLDTVGGRVFPVEDFLEGAVEQIAAWVEAPPLLAEASRQARSRFLELHQESQVHFGHLAAMLLGSEQTEMLGDGAIARAPPRQTG
jgi:succinoglycan biosynthesis protein ExoL